MAAPDEREHALKLKDEVTWLIDGLRTFVAADGEAGARAAAWAELLGYLVMDLDQIIGDQDGESEKSRWSHDEVVSVLCKLLIDEGKGSVEGAEHMAREFIKDWMKER